MFAWCSVCATLVFVARLLLCGGGQLGLWELICGDAWVTGERDCVGLLEHVCLSSLRGICVGGTQEEHLSEEEHEKTSVKFTVFRCLLTLTIRFCNDDDG